MGEVGEVPQEGIDLLLLQVQKLQGGGDAGVGDAGHRGAPHQEGGVNVPVGKHGAHLAGGEVVGLNVLLPVDAVIPQQRLGGHCVGGTGGAQADLFARQILPALDAGILPHQHVGDRGG